MTKMKPDEIGVGNVAMKSDLTERALDGLHEWLLARVLELRGITRESRVLDLGCGTGAWLERLHAAGFRDLFGMDIDESAFAAHDVAQFRARDLNSHELSLGDGNFELITAIEVIEHLANPSRIFAHAAKHLAPDRWIVVTTPNIYALGARLRFLLSGKLRWFDEGAPDHLHPVIVETFLRQVLPPLGLGVVSIRSYPEAHALHSRGLQSLALRVLSIIVPNQLPGDVLCLLVRRSVPAIINEEIALHREQLRDSPT
jgi:SAM-dependent methyltransferase